MAYPGTSPRFPEGAPIVVLSEMLTSSDECGVVDNGVEVEPIPAALAELGWEF